jgi:hypothetical protein
MRTTLKIENGTRTLEVDLKLVDGRHLVELELSQLLEFVGQNGSAAKPAKSDKTVKAKISKYPTTAANQSADSEPVKKNVIGAKRGRKPKVAILVDGIKDPSLT